MLLDVKLKWGSYDEPNGSKGDEEVNGEEDDDEDGEDGDEDGEEEMGDDADGKMLDEVGGLWWDEWCVLPGHEDTDPGNEGEEPVTTWIDVKDELEEEEGDEADDDDGDDADEGVGGEENWATEGEEGWKGWYSVHWEEVELSPELVDGDIETHEEVISLAVSLWPQQEPKSIPSTHVPKCFPSVFMHSHTNMQVPSSPSALVHGFGVILSPFPGPGQTTNGNLCQAVKLVWGHKHFPKYFFFFIPTHLHIHTFIHLIYTHTLPYIPVMEKRSKRTRSNLV